VAEQRCGEASTSVLDLFSGIGGFSLGLERAGFHTAAFCEIDPYCRAVLAKHWPGVPCFEDIRTIDASRLGELGRIDLICGGFPCQPFSVAGERRAQNDDRHLWPEMRRVIALARPAWVVGENVTGLITLALDDVLADLEGLGYTARPFVIPACAVGAPHRRERVFIVAHAQRSEQPWQEPCDGPARRVGRQQQPVSWNRSWQAALREFRGMDDGSAYRVDRVDSIRNAVVPQVAEEIGRAILRCAA
jgi:DNA (cytosine-5)-methyltransferase 1